MNTVKITLEDAWRAWSEEHLPPPGLRFSGQADALKQAFTAGWKDRAHAS